MRFATARFTSPEVRPRAAAGWAECISGTPRAEWLMEGGRTFTTVSQDRKSPFSHVPDGEGFQNILLVVVRMEHSWSLLFS